MANLILGPNISDTVTGGRTLKLSAYDKVRKIHPVVTDPKVVISIGPRTLSNELDCPVCLDLFNKTTVTKRCLHRFCSDCITSALQHANKECPSCRTKLVSRRSTRHDNNTDMLIKAIWADRSVYERMQKPAAVIEEGLASLQASISAGIKAQAANRRQRIQGSYDLQSPRRKRHAFDEPSSSTAHESFIDDELEDPDPGRIYDFHSEGSEEPDDDSSSGVTSDSSMLSFAESDVSVGSDICPNAASVLEARAALRLPPGIKAIIERAHMIIQHCVNYRIPRALYDDTPIAPINDTQKLSCFVELELVPTIALKKRLVLPAPAVLNHCICILADASISSLSLFLPQRIQDVLRKRGFSDADARKVINKAEFFFVVTQDNKMRPLALTDTLQTAYALSSNTSEHMLIFYDTDVYVPEA